MKRTFLRGAEKYLEEKQRRKRWYAVMAVLVCVTVFCTVYALIRSGIAMESNHIHSSECYTQVKSISRVQLACNMESLQLREGVQLHKHSSACYDSEGNLVCGYTDFVIHKHDNFCYDENGSLLCMLPEIEEHEHTSECYAQVQQDTGVPSAAGAEGEESAMAAEEAAAPEQVLVCDKPEIILHEHTDACRDEMNNLICGKVQVLAHQHTEACYKTVEEPIDTTSLTCTLPEDENHTHGPLCYGTWELTCGKEERRPANEQQDESGSAETEAPDDISADISSTAPEDASDSAFEDISSIEPESSPSSIPADATDSAPEDAFSSAPDTIPGKKNTKDITSSMHEDESEADTLHALTDPSQAGLKISLLYGDQKAQSEHPDGQSYYTHSTMSGYIKLEPNNLTEKLENVVVTLTIPKEYVEEGTVNIPKFNTNSTITKYEISTVSEDDNNYYISIHFFAYDQTQTLTLPFALSFIDDKVPDNYRLEVTASVSQGNTLWSTTGRNIYKPQYKDWGIQKFVNSNREDAFQKDGAEAVVTPKEEGGNPYLDNDAYVDFAFRVNNVINSGSNLENYRDVTSVTLTDTLPTYQDKDRNQCTAVFDESANPGWTLSNNGTTVTKTYTGANSSDVLNKIYNDKLKLRFPGLRLNKKKENGSVYAELKNEVDLEAIPSGEVQGETRPKANDPLIFRISDDLGTKGKFAKVKLKGNIYDLKEYKTNPYPWRIRLSNDGIQPLRNIRIEDRNIVDKNGNVEVKGVDEALKFVKLESDLSDSIPATGKSFAEIVDKVVAYYTDGTTEDIPIGDKVDGSGNFLVEFNKDKECNGYVIIFKSDYEMAFKEAASFKAYTVYRNPDQTCVPEGTASIYYENQARSVNEYTNSDGTPAQAFLWSWSGYDMFPIKEELKISKDTWYNDETKNQMVGGEYAYYIYLQGSLLTPEQKKYGDIRIVDLLPNEVDFVRTTNGWGEYTNSAGQNVSGDRIKPDIIENYKNSGRTAVIYHITYEKLTERWNERWNGLVSFFVKIREDAHPGTVQNDVYVVGDNLEEYSGSTGYAMDTYDLDNDGRTDDKIAYAHSDATIIAAQSIYAEKFIAPAGSDNWSKQGLSLKAGSKFDYKLNVTNETDDAKTGLVVYDTLPAIDDNGIFGANPRNSEFRVHLREAIQAPEGYTVYYTTSQEVYQSSMDNMINQEDIWASVSSVADFSQVTAFKLVADEGTTLSKDSPFEVRIPACVPDNLSEESMEKLKEKNNYESQQSGTMAYLESVNSFGYKTNKGSPAESNKVWTRIPFAGFIIKKVDGNSHAAIEGAEFTLTKDGGSTYTATSNENGFLEFRDLTEGTYTLKETKVPAGYVESHKDITVRITQNAATMEYQVEFDDFSDVAGNKENPLIIENAANNYELPATGSGGATSYIVGGFLLAAAASLLLYARMKHGRA